MLAMLQEMRARGTRLEDCAERIGVCYASAVYKARELGIANRLNRGRMPGVRAVLEASR